MDKVLEDLYKKKAALANKKDPESIKLLEEGEKYMEEKYSEDMYGKIKEELKGINYEEGGWNSGHLWKLRRKISPRPVDPPTAMENPEGVL